MPTQTQTFLSIIKAITKYGISSDIKSKTKAKDLEKALVKLYAISFEIDPAFDEEDYPEFDISLFPNVIENVKQNFPDFGYYHYVLNPTEVHNEIEPGISDAIDDISDIIYDLLETKWRMENNSIEDGLWHFKLSFWSHTQQHLVDLLVYLKAKEG